MNRIVKSILLAIAYLVLSPIVFGIVALALSYCMHIVSGEGNELGSGDPWMVMGVMLFFPLAVVCGIGIGTGQAIGVLWNAWKESK